MTRQEKIAALVKIRNYYEAERLLGLKPMSSEADILSIMWEVADELVRQAILVTARAMK